jgi:hypothetical protein
MGDRLHQRAIDVDCRDTANESTGQLRAGSRGVKTKELAIALTESNGKGGYHLRILFSDLSRRSRL